MNELERVQPPDESGATAVEYGLLVALIAAVIIGVVASVGLKLLPGFEFVVANWGS